MAKENGFFVMILFDAVPTALEAGTQGTLVVGCLLVQSSRLVGIVRAHGLNLLMLRLCIGRIAGRPNRRTGDTPSDGTEATVIRTGDDCARMAPATAPMAVLVPGGGPEAPTTRS